MNKGVSLYLAILIMSILLALVLGLTAISFSQLKTIKGIENSVIAFYAADSGIEEILKKIIYDRDEANLTSPYPDPPATLGNGAIYQVEVVCCSSLNQNCNFFDPEENCPSGLSEDSSCSSFRYCIRSKGTYGGTKRAIEVTYGVQQQP